MIEPEDMPETWGINAMGCSRWDPETFTPGQVYEIGLKFRALLIQRNTTILNSKS